jgi:hypothetical protein
MAMITISVEIQPTNLLLTFIDFSSYFNGWYREVAFQEGQGWSTLVQGLKKGFLG